MVAPFASSSIADALLHGYLGGIPVNDAALGLQEALTDHLVTIWEQADHGIWEVRGEPKNFTYSKVMACRVRPYT